MDGHALVLAEGTAGGILLAWDKDMFTEAERKVGKYCVSVDVVANWDSTVIRFTGVYGPSTNREKGDFFQELKEMKPQIEMPWMVAGDFNVTLDIQDRSNTRYPIAPMMRFRAVVQQLQLINMPLQGRRYTWTREGTMPMAVRLDRFLMSMHWERYTKEARQQKTLCAECIAWLVEQKEERGLTEVEEMLQGIMQQRHNQIVMQEEEKWKQRAKQTWVKLGDKNTRYFHRVASIRKRKSNIDVVVQGEMQVIEHN
ncbi:uncharacterized protein LOC144559920 [Carex rostrata]